MRLGRNIFMSGQYYLIVPKFPVNIVEQGKSNDVGL